MKFWSKGLGKRSLNLALGTEVVETDEEQVLLSGEVVEPVSWHYIMFLDGSDWVEFFEAALKPQMATYLLTKKRMGLLVKLTLFLFKFLGLYAMALMRAAVGKTIEPTGIISAIPDFTAKAEIENG